MTTNYFSHDSNARNDDKLLRLRMRHGAAGYGVYFMILERMRDESNYMCVKDYNTIAFDLRVDAALIKSVIEDFGLFVFTDDGKYFYSASFLRRMEVKDEASKKRSMAGIKGSAKRWGKSQCYGNAIAMPSQSDNKRIASKESKESKENNILPPLTPPEGENRGGGNEDEFVYFDKPFHDINNMLAPLLDERVYRTGHEKIETASVWELVRLTRFASPDSFGWKAIEQWLKTRENGEPVNYLVQRLQQAERDGRLSGIMPRNNFRTLLWCHDNLNAATLRAVIHAANDTAAMSTITTAVDEIKRGGIKFPDRFIASRIAE
jgi:hypothetical protein